MCWALAVFHYNSVAAWVLWISLCYDQCAAPLCVFCPHLWTIHYLQVKDKKVGKHSEAVEKKNLIMEQSGYIKHITCSLFLIQQDATGGLPLKTHVRRAVCASFTSRCCGGFSKCNVGPVKPKHSECFDFTSCFLLAGWVRLCSFEFLKRDTGRKLYPVWCGR